MFNIFMKDERMNDPKEKRMSKMFKYTRRAFCYLSQKKIWKSLCNWNKLLTNRPEKAIEACIYQERSKIYFKNNLYKQCLRNIKLVEEREDLTLELEKNKYFCERQIDRYGIYEEYRKPKQFLKLSYTANPKIPYIVNCLNAAKSQKGNGYNITTTQDLKIGDIICIEDPFFTVSTKSDGRTQLAEKKSNFKRCYHCHESNFLDLIQCFNCDGKSNLFKF